MDTRLKCATCVTSDDTATLEQLSGERSRIVIDIGKGFQELSLSLDYRLASLAKKAARHPQCGSPETILAREAVKFTKSREKEKQHSSQGCQSTKWGAACLPGGFPVNCAVRNQGRSQVCKPGTPVQIFAYLLSSFILIEDAKYYTIRASPQYLFPHLFIPPFCLPTEREVGSP